MLSTISWVLKTEITALSIRNTYKVIQHMPRRKVKLESFLSSSSEKKKMVLTPIWAVLDGQ